MPLEAPLAPVATRVADLNRRYAHHSATAVLEHAIGDPAVGRIAMVSSFGAESVALLHMLSVIDRTVPVVFLDTEMLFPETLTYQRDLAERLRLDVRVQRPDREAAFLRDPDATLHRNDPDACCHFRKTEPLLRALSPFDGWITGRKRYQGAGRAALDFFEVEPGTDRIKVNPLVHWNRDDVQEYMINNRLPRHPLVAEGFRSIGCAPCTSRVRVGEDERAGRWRGSDKVECGIHFVDGKMVRAPL